MFKSFKLSPTIFLLCEFFILFPSVLYILGIILGIFHDFFLLDVMLKRPFIQSVFITIIMPFAGGFVSYHFLERYGPKGFIMIITKGILMYSILEIGLLTAYVLFFSVHR